MPANISINIKGIKEVQDKFGKTGQQKLLRDISIEMEIAAQDLRTKAVNKAPVNTGILRAGIEVDGKDLRWIVYTVAEYAGYVEFGTKTKVSVPPDMQDEAAKFKGGKGSYEDFKASILVWMRGKGIPASAAYPIMAKILSVGIDPQPFMYPAMQQVQAYIDKEIDSVIQKYLDK